MLPPPDLEMLGSLPQEAEATFWGVKKIIKNIIKTLFFLQFQFKYKSYIFNLIFHVVFNIYFFHNGNRTY